MAVFLLVLAMLLAAVGFITEEGGPFTLLAALVLAIVAGILLASGFPAS